MHLPRRLIAHLLPAVALAAVGTATADAAPLVGTELGVPTAGGIARQR